MIIVRLLPNMTGTDECNSNENHDAEQSTMRMDGLKSYISTSKCNFNSLLGQNDTILQLNCNLGNVRLTLLIGLLKPKRVTIIAVYAWYICFHMHIFHFPFHRFTYFIRSVYISLVPTKTIRTDSILRWKKMKKISIWHFEKFVYWNGGLR